MPSGSGDQLENVTCSVIAEIEGLVVTATYEQVEMHWALPGGVNKVQITRSLAGIPAGVVNRSIRIIECVGTSSIDQAVLPGESYEYRIQAVLNAAIDSTETEILSSGILKRVRVPGKPRAIDEFVVTTGQRDGTDGLSVSWRYPERSGRVLVYVKYGEAHLEVVHSKVMPSSRFRLQEELIGTRISAAIDSWREGQHIEWIKLDRDLDRPDELRWTVTLVTELDDSFVIGASRTVSLVDSISYASVEERVDWQLLKVNWPAGANFLAIWHVSVGEACFDNRYRLFDRKHYIQFGGVAMNLTWVEQDVVVCGVSMRNGEAFFGEQMRRTYYGRWLLEYSIVEESRWRKRTTRLVVNVERKGWPDLNCQIFEGEYAYPLDARSGRMVWHGRIEKELLNSEGSKELIIANIADARGKHHLVVDPVQSFNERLDFDPATLVVRDPLPQVSSTPPSRTYRPPLCPRCLSSIVDGRQYFRCEGTCESAIDLEYQRLHYPGLPFDPGHARHAMPVFDVPSAVGSVRNSEPGLPLTNAGCPRCHAVSFQQVCGTCHAELAQDCWSRDILGVVVVGERGAGKTTYLNMLLSHLHRNLLPRMGGNLSTVDEHSHRILEPLSASTGPTRVDSTQGALSNPDILKPMVVDICRDDETGRMCALALFDVAGEDMVKIEGIRPYSPALSKAHLIIFLIDPLQLDGLRDWVPSSWLPERNKVAPATIVSNIAKQIRARLMLANSGPLPVRAAVVFSKFDRIQEAARDRNSKIGRLIGPGSAIWQDPYVTGSAIYSEADGIRVHDEVRALLLEVGETGTVSAVEQEFANVRYFAVSSLGHDPTRDAFGSVPWASPQRVGDPLRWGLWLRNWAGRRPQGASGSWYMSATSESGAGEDAR